MPAATNACDRGCCCWPLRVRPPACGSRSTKTRRRRTFCCTVRGGRRPEPEILLDGEVRVDPRPSGTAPCPWRTARAGDRALTTRQTQSRSQDGHDCSVVSFRLRSGRCP
jgi:hypothetical protein